MGNFEMPSGYTRMVDLAADVARRHALEPARIISVDGWDGSGKTTLATDLAAHLSFAHYELDAYLHREQGGFLEHLDYARLATALRTRAPATQPPLVEGICVLQVLDRLDLRSDIKIYVRRISASGIWHDGLRIDPSKTVEQVIADDRRAAELWAEIDGEQFVRGHEPLAWEVIRYHYAYTPHETADFYFNRIED
jgi:hypothetical protein